MDDLRRAREEMRALREELQRTRDERDKWKIRNHDVPSECYYILKQHRLQSEMSLQTLQHLDAPAAIKRLEAHEQYMEHLFANGSGDFAAKVQTVIQEIQFVKTTMGGDTLRWRLYSALNLMLHISRGLQKILAPRPGTMDPQQNSLTVACDDYLKSTLKSADVQLMSTLNEIRERSMDDYFLAFRERFAPEYDLIHNEYGQEFYERTKVLMVHMCSRLRALALPQPRLDEVVSRNISNEEQDDLETTWI
ncbi:hypothetical protein E8E13_002587 [Curvularia kusanoi]|uniref:Uncharacterized protein n=1 Tax=Curvularia kusanoi TaxID=90978 RepID=A0A9P4T6V8_CURKU|nr:hypothetical protein E8E13_002587 [Curvularia kusanoi]